MINLIELSIAHGKFHQAFRKGPRSQIETTYKFPTFMCQRKLYGIPIGELLMPECAMSPYGILSLRREYLRGSIDTSSITARRAEPDLVVKRLNDCYKWQRQDRGFYSWLVAHPRDVVVRCKLVYALLSCCTMEIADFEKQLFVGYSGETTVVLEKGALHVDHKKYGGLPNGKSVINEYDYHEQVKLTSIDGADMDENMLINMMERRYRYGNINADDVLYNQYVGILKVFTPEELEEVKELVLGHYDPYEVFKEYVDQGYIPKSYVIEPFYCIPCENEDERLRVAKRILRVIEDVSLITNPSGDIR